MSALITKKTSASSDLHFTLSSETPDLVGDVVVQKGLKPARSPLPAQIDHGGGMFDLVGAWHDIKVIGTKTVARLELLPPGVSKAADLVRSIHEAGIQLAASIGFRPEQYEPIKQKLTNGSEKITGIKFTKAVLTEASIVVTPCNPEALAFSKSLDESERTSLSKLLEAGANDKRTKAEATLNRINRKLLISKVRTK